MEESFETFEEELWPPRPEAPPKKPFRHIQREDMYAARKMKEESPPPTTQIPQSVPRQTSNPPTRSMSLRKSLSIQNLSQIDTPWENVTLNRCLFVAISILVLTSGLQRLHEVVRGRRGAEEEEVAGLAVRRSALRIRAPPEPEPPLWEVLLSWLPDLSDDDNSGGAKTTRSKRGGAENPPRRRQRNRPAPEKSLTREGGGRLAERRAKRERDEDTTAKKKGKRAKLREEEEEEEEVVIPKKKKSKAGKL
ncbi:junctional sarcoplasmic reticulum protein 1 [Osmerus eperlanus]|uniref:junctional sarcoplasmic reticulum protein 1 n=1 Tax=Osmerus eperlanus TaxID=29151 RepID=UPI002E15E382